MNKPKNSQPLYGVIGDPIAHSKSPVLHKAALKALQLPGDYQAFHVLPTELKKIIARVRTGEITGLNVTVPHKVAIKKLVDRLTPEAQAIGAVNTIYHSQGKLIGHNTDGAGYLASLKNEASFAPKGKYAVMIGAGGAALAVGHALCQAEIKSLHIANRDGKKAIKFAKRLANSYPRLILSAGNLDSLNEQTLGKAHLLVNTTQMGMQDTPWIALNFLKSLPRTALVSDIVYNPRQTELLKAARRLKLKTHEGLGMLLHQGALAFQKFTGKKAPIDVMRRALLKALSI
jgi:shikimate dehydrogenase